MRRRCYDKGVRGYERYGGRGVEVWPAWRESYAAFLSDVGRRPSANHSLDRINSDGHYMPGNVRWATKKEQQNNLSHDAHAPVPPLDGVHTEPLQTK